MKKILLVEDDEFFRAAVRGIISGQYEVFEANNGKIAKDIISMQDFDLIVSDIQMPFLTGVELLSWVIENKKNTPVILMTGFAQILETQKAHSLGAADFIPKPFKAADLLEKINKILKPSAPAAEAASKAPEENFCKVPIEDFLTDKDTEYGIFVKVSEGKFIKIAHKGGKISEDRVKVFKDKGVHFLYVHPEDFKKIIGFAVNLSKIMSTSSKVDEAKKLRFLQYTGNLIVQKAFVSDVDQELFYSAKDFLTSSLSVISQNPDCVDMLEQLNSHTDYLYAHSLGVSMYSVMIAKRMGITSSQTLFKVAMAGLFHDIGNKEIPAEILCKPRLKLTADERALIETHPTRGAELLESMRGMPSDVIQVVFEHHENILGTGYPRRLEKGNIHPLSLVVMAADEFCNLTLKSPNNEQPLSASEAISKLMRLKISMIDPVCFQALTNVIMTSK